MAAGVFKRMKIIDGKLMCPKDYVICHYDSQIIYEYANKHGARLN